VNLHHHSTFSFGDGFGTPAQHVERAVELGYRAIALTEHGNVSSHFQLEKAANKAGIKPIFGMEAYCGGVGEQKSQWKHHLTLIARNEEGYRNLNRITTDSYKQFYYHPTVAGKVLQTFRHGIVVLSGCSGSDLACALLGGKGTPEHNDIPNWDAARQTIERYTACFGENYWLEVQPFFELPRTIAMNTCYARLSRDTGISLVVTHDVHYPRMEDAEMQAILHTVHRGKASVDDTMREWNYEVPLTLPATDKELQLRLEKTGLSRADAMNAIANSSAISDVCNVTLPKAERLRYPITEQDLLPWK
jgi:DNA polymerase-3 subunit alpha